MPSRSCKFELPSFQRVMLAERMLFGVNVTAHCRALQGIAEQASTCFTSSLPSHLARALKQHGRALETWDAMPPQTPDSRALATAGNEVECSGRTVEAFAALVETLAQTEHGATLLLGSAAYAGNDTPSQLAEAIAAWLHGITASQSWLHDPLQRQTLAWLRALNTLLRAPSAPAQCLRSCCASCVHVLECCARQHSASPAELAEPLRQLCMEVAAIARDSPFAAAAITSTSSHTWTVLATALHETLGCATVDAVATKRVQRLALGSMAAERECAVAWDCAAATLQCMTTLARAHAVQSIMLAAGLDVVLVAALLSAPLLRCPADEGELLGANVARALALLQVRLSWRRTAACMAPNASSAVSMTDADTALPALLQGLHRGTDTRCCPETASPSNLGSEQLCDHLSQATCVDHVILHVDAKLHRMISQRACPTLQHVLNGMQCPACRLADLEACEDRQLVLAMLVQPLCGDPEAEAALIALLGEQQPLGLVGAGCRSALGASAPGAVPRALPRCTHLSAAKAQSRTAPAQQADSRDASTAACDVLPHALQWRYDSTDIARAHCAATLAAPSQPSAVAADPPAPAAPAIACLEQPSAADTHSHGMEKWWSRASNALWDDVVSAHTQRPPVRKECAVRRLLSKHDVAKLLKHAAFVAAVRACTEPCTDIMVLHVSWLGSVARRAPVIDMSSALALLLSANADEDVMSEHLLLPADIW